MSTCENFGKSHFDQIPSEWEVKNLGQILEIVRGFAFESNDYIDFGVLNFRVSNVGRQAFDIGDVQFLPNEFFYGFPKQQLYGGEIVIVMVGASTGKLGRVPSDICPALMNQNMWLLKPKKGINQDYLWQLLPLAVNKHMQMSQGSARDFLKQFEFKRTIVTGPFDNHQEQFKIAEILSTVDRAIEQTEGLITKHQRIKIGLMQDLLTRGIDEHGNLRTEETHEFKDSLIGRIPVEWMDSQLGNTVLQIKRGPSLSTNNEMRGIIYLTSDNISDSGELIWPIIKYLDLRSSNLNSILDIGDVILNCVNSEAQIGKVGFVDKLPGITTTGFNNFALSFDTDLLLPKFAFYLLSCEQFQRALRKKIKPAINQSSFSAKDLADLPVVSPKIEEQLLIVKELDQISKAAHRSQKTLAKLNKIKTALMQDLLTGNIRVTPLLKEKEKNI